MNAANGLTAVRFVLVPVFVALTWRPVVHSRAARRRRARVLRRMGHRLRGRLDRPPCDLVTDVGKIADPIADKALTGRRARAALGLGALPWWVTIVILGREIGVTALRILVIRQA